MSKSNNELGEAAKEIFGAIQDEAKRITSNDQEAEKLALQTLSEFISHYQTSNISQRMEVS